MGNLELPGAATGSKQMLKVPVGTYEFGANLISEKGVSSYAHHEDAIVTALACQHDQQPFWCPFSCAACNQACRTQWKRPTWVCYVAVQRVHG
jgi:hypothetical protein